MRAGGTLGVALVLLSAAQPAWAAIDAPEIEATFQRTRLELSGTVIQLESRTEGQQATESSTRKGAGFLGLSLGPLFLAGGGESSEFKQEGATSLERVLGQRNFSLVSLAWSGVFGSADGALVFSAIDGYRSEEYDLRYDTVDFSSRTRTDTDGKYGLSLVFPALALGVFAGTEKQRFAADAAPDFVREQYKYPVETAFLVLRRAPERGFTFNLSTLSTRGGAAEGAVVRRKASQATASGAAVGYGFARGSGVQLAYNQETLREEFEDVKLTRQRTDTATLEVQVTDALTLGMSHEVTREKTRVLTTFPLTETVQTTSALNVTWNY